VEDSKEVTRFGSRKAPIKISIKEFDSGKVVDIRKFFMPKGSDELKPTKKGVTLQWRNFGCLINELAAHAPEIYKEVMPTDTELNDRLNELNSLREHAEDIRNDLPDWSVSSNHNGEFFFDLKVQGSEHSLSLDKNHSFSAELLDIKNNDQVNPETERVIHLIEKMLVALARTRDAFDSDEEMSTVIEMFMHQLETTLNQ